MMRVLLGSVRVATVLLSVVGHLSSAGPAVECSESEDQHSLFQKRSPAELERQASNASAALLPGYDCDGDGAKDCGEWDFGLSQCRNPGQCKHYLVGCQCRRCTDQGQASSDLSLQHDKPTNRYYGKWMNWGDTIDTCAPWLMPKDDCTLRKLLAYARLKGYKVRPSGATHSSGGLVTDGQDMQTVVVSLAEYQAPLGWEFEWLDMPDGSKRVRVNAGWNQMQLYAKIRPWGYFLPTQTVGSFFQLAGIVANSVHGGMYSEGFVYEAVTGLRVMLADGSIRHLEAEADLRLWRNSYGLLGIILSVELKLAHRPQFQMYTVQRQLPGWNRQHFWRFLMDDASAELPQRPGEAAFGQFFVNFLEEPPRMLALVEREGEHANAPGIAHDVPPSVTANYEQMLAQPKFSPAHGLASYSDLSRREGAPPISMPSLPTMNVPMDKLLQMLPRSNRSFNVEVAKGLASMSFMGIPAYVNDSRRLVNDGFYLRETPRTVCFSFFMEALRAFEVLDLCMNFFRQNHQALEGFLWNQPMELRFVNVASSATLQPVEPGRYVSFEVLAFPGTAKDEQEYLEAFYELQEALEAKFGSLRPHIAKLFGLDKRNGHLEPYHPSRTCKIYTKAQKDEFNSYRVTVDPSGLFAQGLGLQLLSECPAS